MEDDPPPRKLKLGEARFENLNKDAPAEHPVDVHEMMQSTLKRTMQGEKPLDPTRKMSRNRRDYWICMSGVNVFFGGLYFTLDNSVVTMAIFLFGVSMTNGILAWILLFIADD